jgi:hypothetical protein
MTSEKNRQVREEDAQWFTLSHFLYSYITPTQNDRGVTCREYREGRKEAKENTHACICTCMFIVKSCPHHLLGTGSITLLLLTQRANKRQTNKQEYACERKYTSCFCLSTMHSYLKDVCLCIYSYRSNHHIVPLTRGAPADASALPEPEPYFFCAIRSAASAVINALFICSHNGPDTN